MNDGERRAALVSAARAVYEREGARGFTLQNVAVEACVAVRLVRRYFADREAMLDAVADVGFELLERRVRASLYEGGAALPERVLSGFLDFALDEPALYEVMFLTPRRELGAFRGETESRRSATFRLACEGVRGEMASGHLRHDDPLETTLTLWAHAHGLIAMQLVGRFGRDPEKFRGLYARSIRRMLSGLAPDAGTASTPFRGPALEPALKSSLEPSLESTLESTLKVPVEAIGSLTESSGGSRMR